MNSEELSENLREGEQEFLAQRRINTGLTMFNIAAMGVISLYQMGVIKHLPEPPLPKLDADKVNGSAEAYEILETPDGVLGLGSYAATLGLIAMAGSERNRTRPWIPLTLLAKTLFDAAVAIKLLIDQPTKYKAYCLYCIASALSSIATVPYAWPEARAAWRHGRDRA